MTIAVMLGKCSCLISGLVWWLEGVESQFRTLYTYWGLVHHETLVRYLKHQHISKRKVLVTNKQKTFKTSLVRDIIGQTSVLPQWLPQWLPQMNCATQLCSLLYIFIRFVTQSGKQSSFTTCEFLPTILFYGFCLLTIGWALLLEQPFSFSFLFIYFIWPALPRNCDILFFHLVWLAKLDWTWIDLW